MIFSTKVAGIPCQIRVVVDNPGTPAEITGRMEDSYPGDPAEFDFQVLDRRGRHAPWLERKLTESDYLRIEQEYREH